MGLAYRELIGSLYESWTIGIGRVCKKLINSIIQQCQKCQKRGFEAKERGILTPSLSQGEGECSDGKGECSDGKSEGMMEKCNGNHY